MPDARNRNETCSTHFATAAGTWVAKLLLFMLVISFAIWGISGQMIGGFGSSHVIAAGGTTVSLKEYRLAYERQVQIMSQQLGTRLTREQAVAFGVDQQVLAQLVTGAVLDEQARKLGLGVSKDRLAQLARDDPAFKGPGRQVRPPAVRAGAAAGRHDCRGLSAAIVSKSLSASRSSRRFRTDCTPRMPSSRRWRSIAARIARSTTSTSRGRWSSRSRRPASRSQDLVRGAQGDLRGAGIPQVRLHQARPGSIWPIPRRSATSRSRRITTSTRPLHDAGNAQDRAARLPDARRRQDGATIRCRPARPSKTSSRRRARRWPTCSSAPSPRRSPRSGDRRRRFRAHANEVSPPVTGSFGPVLLRVTDISRKW